MTAPNIPDLAPVSQWVFDWDDTAGGWRGTAGGWQTGAYMNPGAARKAVENGAVYASGTAVVQTEASETSAANAVSEGLASCQQSSNEQMPGSGVGPRSGHAALSAALAPARARLEGRAVPESDAEAAQRREQLPKSRYTSPDHYQELIEERRYQDAKRRAKLANQPDRLAALGQAGNHNKRRRLAKEATEARRFCITVQNSGGVLHLDSKAMRLRRAQRRVHAWAEAVPKDKRTVKRAGKVLELGPRMVMIRLSYADADTEHKKSEGWKPNDIRDFMKKVKKELDTHLLGYAWVMEMQERGSVHYHVLLYLKRGSRRMPKPDEAGWWPHGGTRIETSENPFYIVKYVGKEQQKEGLPKNARMFAVWINPNVITVDKLLTFRMSSLPKWMQTRVQEMVKAGHVGKEVRWTRPKGGGWLIRDTGEIIPSEWELVSITPWAEGNWDASDEADNPEGE